MATTLEMPKMGYDMTEGRVLKWLKKEGQEVKRGEIIAEIETDKASVEMESPTAGILRRIVVSEGAKVPVGEIIAYIGTADEAIPDAKASPAKPAAESKPATAPAQRPPTAAASERSTQAPAADQAPVLTGSGADGQRVSPVARRIADELGVDVRQVRGTGPGGRVTKDDVQAFAAQPKAAPAPAAQPSAPAAQPRTAAPAAPVAAGPQLTINGQLQRVELSRMGQAIARRTVSAKQTIPHYYVTMAVDMTKAMEFRTQLNEALANSAPAGSMPMKISVNDIVLKACAVALMKHAKFNSVFKDDHIEIQPHINLGVAISLPDGLIVPAILECERKSLVQIAHDAKELGERTRANKLRNDELNGGTFSVSNMGMFDVDSFVSIIVAPQSAVLAVGKVQPTPVVRDNQVVVRQIMQATLSADHRVSNGTDSALFLGEIRRLLENPLLLVA